jgi:hypothetical protein
MQGRQKAVKYHNKQKGFMNMKFIFVPLLFLFFFMDVFSQTTFDIELIAAVNDGSNLGVAVYVKGNNLPSAKTLNSSTIDVTYDNSLLTFANASGWAFGTAEGYSRSADNNITKITITITGGGVGADSPGIPAGFDLSSSYVKWVQLNFTHTSPDSTTNINIDNSTVALSLFETESNNPNNGNNISYTSSSINLHGLSNQMLPVELSSFSASVNVNNVTLNWKTATEVNNSGFAVERAQVNSQSQILDPRFKKIAFIPGHGSSSSPKEYSYTDKNLTGGTKFKYRLKQIDNNGQFKYSKEIEIQIVPKQFALYQNYPNPFNPSTTIKFDLPEASKVILNVYNILGQKVVTLLNKTVDAGFHQMIFNGDNFPSGTYIYRIQAGNFIQTKKMLLIK